MTTSVLVVDDEALLRTAFSALIDAEDDLEVAGEAANGRRAVELATRLSPDVVVMDVRMPVMDGIEATRQITSAHGPWVLILTTFDLDEYVFEALRAGASGFALKSRPLEELLSAIRTIAAGEALLAPSVTRRLIAHFAGQARARAPRGLAELTEREREVLALVAQGMIACSRASHARVVSGAGTLVSSPALLSSPVPVPSWPAREWWRSRSSSTQSRTRSSRASGFTSPVTNGSIAASHAIAAAASPSSHAPPSLPPAEASARRAAQAARTRLVHSSCRAELPSSTIRSAREICAHTLTGCPARSGSSPAVTSRCSASCSASWYRCAWLRSSSAPAGADSASGTVPTIDAHSGLRSPVRTPAPSNVVSSLTDRSSNA